MTQSASKTAAQFDVLWGAIYALLFAFTIFNVGAGMFIGAIGIYYFAPVMFLFGAASFALSHNWRSAQTLHRVAGAAALCPPVLLISYCAIR